MEPRTLLYPRRDIPLDEAVTELLVDKGLARPPVDLERLHERLEPRQLQLDANYLNPISAAFYLLDDRLLAAYRQLIRWLLDELEHDFCFQARPIVRFHFPVPFPAGLRTRAGRPLYVHSDVMGGHPPEMLNLWVPLTRAYGSNALLLLPPDTGDELLERFFAATVPFDPTTGVRDFFALLDADDELLKLVVGTAKPIEMEPGQCLLFPGPTIHGATENREPTTRVSLDFRIIRLERYEREVAPHGGRFVRGEVLDRRTASELGDQRTR